MRQKARQARLLATAIVVNDMEYTAPKKFGRRDVDCSGAGYGFGWRDVNFIVRKARNRNFLQWVEKQVGKKIKIKDCREAA